MLLRASLAGLLLVASQVGHAAAGVLNDLSSSSAASSTTLLLYDPSSDDLVRRTDDFVQAAIERRQQGSPTPSGSPASPIPQGGDAADFDITVWNTQTQKACVEHLTALNGQASNPSGLAMCYNLPFYDNVTGVFQAEIRMYRISEPSGDWSGVSINDINLSLTYPGAQIQSTASANSAKLRRDQGTIRRLLKRIPGLGLIKRQGGLSELKIVSFVAKVNNDLIGTSRLREQPQNFLTPSITLSAVSPNTAAQLTTTLSSTEASFVNGVFARQAVAGANNVALATVIAVPGLTLAFFPTGLVITLIWTVCFCAAVGAGTIQRVQYRDQYRRRMQRANTMDMKTI